MEYENGMQRDFPRVKDLHLAEISRFDERGFRADLATGRTLDISYGGSRLELYSPLPLRSAVALTLALDNDLVYVKGKTVYLEKLEGQRCAMGIQFTKLSRRSKQLLDEYVDRALAVSNE